MRKILFIFIAVMAFAILPSCKSLSFGLEYNVSITGDGDGDFKVTFPQGYYVMNGTATLDLTLGDTISFADHSYTTKAQVIQRNDAKELKALQSVNDSVANNFEAFAGQGTYDIWINGIVTETATGLSFRVRKHLTNRETDVRKAPLCQDDTYPFVE